MFTKTFFLSNRACYVNFNRTKRFHSNTTTLNTNNTINNKKGLYYLANFLTQEEHDHILKTIDSHPYFEKIIHRRLQFYGEIYYHTTHDVGYLQPSDNYHKKGYSLEIFSWLLNKICSNEYIKQQQILKEDNSNYPTQILVNEYVKNQGISLHVDSSLCFGDYIFTISLCNPIIMEFAKEVSPKQVEPTIHHLLLEPSSLLVLHGEARFLKHGIKKTKHITIDGKQIAIRDQHYRRLSLTIRQLLDGRKKVYSRVD